MTVVCEALMKALGTWWNLTCLMFKQNFTVTTLKKNKRETRLKIFGPEMEIFGPKSHWSLFLVFRPLGSDLFVRWNQIPNTPECRKVILRRTTAFSLVPEPDRMDAQFKDCCNWSSGFEWIIPGGRRWPWRNGLPISWNENSLRKAVLTLLCWNARWQKLDPTNATIKLY